MKQRRPPIPQPKRAVITGSPRPSDAAQAGAAALNAALAMHQQGRLDQAAALYKEILRSQPRHFDALQLLATLAGQRRNSAAAVELFDQALSINPHHAGSLYNRGVALQDLKRPAEALESCDRALTIKPDYPEALFIRGLALRDLDRLDEALQSYDRALTVKPDYAEALNNRGVALRALKRLNEAVESFDRALKIEPGHADALNNRGNALLDLKRSAEALESYDRALRIKPGHADALINRGNALRELKRPQEAIAAFRLALDNGGDPEQIRYNLAALGAEASPAAAPRQFVIKLFDQFASTFDQHLTGTLKYQTPALLLKDILNLAPAGNLDVLDLGCGTGLLGVLLRPLARTLTGVDLSPNMLAMARQRQVFDELICGDVTAFLQTQTGNFDLVVAADVFVYIGELAPVFHGVRQALRAGGLFAFSVEANDGKDFVLRPTLRYAHSIAYLQMLAAIHQFVVEIIEPRIIRQENGSDVDGYHAIMRRP